MNTSLPAVFSENLMDAFHDFDRDFFSDFPAFRDFADFAGFPGFFGFRGPRDMTSGAERALYGKHGPHMMKTDVKETESGYQVAVDLPGFNKEEIRLELENGYLIISTAKSVDRNSEDKDGRMLRQERYTGTMQRSFYVGDQLTEEDIKASYESGVLRLDIPKKEVQSAPKKRTICIEG